MSTTTSTTYECNTVKYEAVNLSISSNDLIDRSIGKFNAADTYNE